MKLVDVNLRHLWLKKHFAKQNKESEESGSQYQYKFLKSASIKIRLSPMKLVDVNLRHLWLKKHFAKQSKNQLNCVPKHAWCIRLSISV